MLNHRFSLRRILFPALFVFVVIAFATSIYLFGRSKSFALFGVGTMTPYFADLRIIAGAVDSEDRGLKPWLENPGDPWHRVLNYPVIWISFFRLIAKWGDPVLIFGMAQLVALLGLGLWLSRQKEGYLAVLFALSPPILLAIERGSNDIFVFLLMLAGVWSVDMLGGIALGLATGLKFFPAVAIVSAVALTTSYRFLFGVALTSPLIVWAFIQLPTALLLVPIGCVWELRHQKFHAPSLHFRSGISWSRTNSARSRLGQHPLRRVLRNGLVDLVQVSASIFEVIAGTFCCRSKVQQVCYCFPRNVCWDFSNW